MGNEMLHGIDTTRRNEIDQLTVGCQPQTPSGILSLKASLRASNPRPSLAFQLHAEFDAGPVDIRLSSHVRPVLGLLQFVALFLRLPPPPSADFRITLPKRTKPTQVQQLNRDGVKAIQKHDYDEAKKLFYQAYLID